jgi:DNA-directed RNA polymerase subunit F
MGIIEQEPLTMAEVSSMCSDDERGEGMKKFIKQFVKMDAEKAIEMKTELKALDLIKLKNEHIVKIVDFMPNSAADLNKVMVDVSLDQEEVNKILDVVKKY